MNKEDASLIVIWALAIALILSICIYYGSGEGIVERQAKIIKEQNEIIEQLIKEKK